MASCTLADTSLGHEVIDTSASLLVSRIPVLHCRILDLSILLHDDLDHRRMELVFITHRRGTSLHVAYI